MRLWSAGALTWIRVCPSTSHSRELEYSVTFEISKYGTFRPIKHVHFFYIILATVSHLKIIILWNQFHQCYTRAFFVQNFWCQNFKPKTKLCNFWRQNFVQKRCMYNVDEIDTWTKPIEAENANFKDHGFQLFCRRDKFLSVSVTHN